MKSSLFVRKFGRGSLVSVLALSILVAGCSGGGEGTQKPSSSNLRTTNNNNVTPSVGGGSTSPSIGSGSGSSTIGYSSNESMEDLSSKIDGMDKKLNAIVEDASDAADDSSSAASWAKWGVIGFGALAALKFVGDTSSNMKAGKGLLPSLWNGLTGNTTEPAAKRATEMMDAKIGADVRAGKASADNASTWASSANNWAQQAAGAAGEGRDAARAIPGVVTQTGQDVIRAGDQNRARIETKIEDLGKKIDVDLAAQNKTLTELRANQLTSDAEQKNAVAKIAELEQSITKNSEQLQSMSDKTSADFTRLNAANEKLKTDLAFESRRVSIALAGNATVLQTELQAFAKDFSSRNYFKDDVKVAADGKGVEIALNDGTTKTVSTGGEAANFITELERKRTTAP